MPRQAILFLTLLVLFIWPIGALAQNATGSEAFPINLDSTLQAPAGFGGAFPAQLGGAMPANLDGVAARISLDRMHLPAEALQPLEAMDFEAADLQDIFYAIASRYNLNILVDEGVARQVSTKLSGLSIVDALVLLCQEHRLNLEQVGSVFRIGPAGATPTMISKSPVEPETASAAEAQQALSQTGEPAPGLVEPNELVVDSSVVDADIAQHISPEEHVEVGPADDAAAGATAVVATPTPENEAFGALPAGVSFHAGRISVNVADASVMDILREITPQMGLSVVTQNAPDSRLTARWSGLTLEEALNVLFKGTNFTWRREGSVIVVADRQQNGMLTTKAIRLRNLPINGMLERLPEQLRQGATFQVIQEQNALVVTGPADAVADVVAFIQEIDAVTPQILIEVLVVEFETTGLRELGVTFLGGLVPAEANVATGEPGWKTYLFGGGNDQGGGLDVLGDGTEGNRVLNFWSDLLGIKSIGRLPTDFYFRLQALERSGQAQVRSRPHIATLSGHAASITVGTTQYFILKSIVPVQTPSLITQGEVEHFERIDADVRLEITPWVTASGDVIAEIRPSFTTPVGMLNAQTPPTLNNWNVNTSVRLKSAETFMIGGLIQEHERVIRNGWPILGGLPLVGRFFGNRRRETRKSELVIFITPHVFYGDESDGEEMGRLQQDMGHRQQKSPQPGSGW